MGYPMSDMSAAFYHYAAEKPVSYDDFMSLARKFCAVVQEKFPGDIDVHTTGGEFTSVKEGCDGATIAEARSSFHAEGINSFPQEIWENTALSRFVFRPQSNRDVEAMMFFDLEEIFNITFILCPANKEIQQKMFPDWQPV